MTMTHQTPTEAPIPPMVFSHAQTGERVARSPRGERVRPTRFHEPADRQR
jgi:hypothetical protein